MRILLSFASFFLLGCYSYVRAPGETPVGTDVELELTDAGASNLARLVGPNVTSIRGRTAQVRADTIQLNVESVMKRSGIDEFWSNEPLSIARADVSAVRVRKLSVARTALMGALAASSAVIIGVAVDNSTGTEPIRPTPPID